ncbi:MAG TPA: CpaF family protein [Baekduia sp.]|nr:CpaF family protein [Baekduia sp.]
MDLRDRIALAHGAEERRDPHADVRDRLHLGLIEELGPQLAGAQVGDVQLRDRVRTEVRALVAAEPALSVADRSRLVEEIVADVLGHGPLEPLLLDESVTEIMVNGPFDVWVERDGRIGPTHVRFADEAHLRRIINKIVATIGRRVDESSPMCDARLPDGSRVNVVVPPVSLSGSLLTIRKFGTERMGLDELLGIGTLTAESAEFLELCLRARLNVLISGGTGSGKTTLLNALSGVIPDDERIVTIEDAAELKLQQRHVLRLESRPSNVEGEGQVAIRDLVRNALRMRPDRIIVGEVRGAEALDMLQAMNTGHDGSLCTVHANSARDALARIETMVLMAGYDLPVRAIRQQVASALDLVVHLERVPGGARRITTVSEVLRMEGDIITTQELFSYEMDTQLPGAKAVGHLRPTGLRPACIPKFERRGVPLPASLRGIVAAHPTTLPRAVGM